MSYTAHTETLGTLKLEIYAEGEINKNPREEWDDECLFGTMATWHRNYTFGSKSKDDYCISNPNEYIRQLAYDVVKSNDYDAIPDEHIQRILNKYYLILPISLYDHSGLTMWGGSGSSPFDPGGWDSGQVGIIYVKVKDALLNWNAKSLDDVVENHEGKKITVRDYAYRILRSEIETYDDYLTGNVYGWRVVDENGGILESCGVYYGNYEKSGCLDEGQYALKSEWKNLSNEIETTNYIEELIPCGAD